MEEKMTSKRRAELRGAANKLEPLFQIGKSGVSPAVMAQTLDVFNTRELIKLKVLLESAPEKPSEIAEKIAAGTQSQVVQVIGGSIILYKENPEIENGTKKKVTVKKKSGVGKGAKDFKKIYNAKKRQEEERREAERRNYYRARRRNYNGGFSK